MTIFEDFSSMLYVDYPPFDPDRFATMDGVEDDTVTNGMRAEEARELAGPMEDTDESNFVDLITDLLHLAHSMGLSPDLVARCAIRNFHNEAGPLDAV